MEGDEITFGDTRISYQIRRSKKRQHLSITVVGSAVEVASPDRTSKSIIRSKIRSKAEWIVSKLDANRNVPPEYPRTMQSGESIRYLGRQYQLKIKQGAERRRVRLWKGKLELYLMSADSPLAEGADEVKQWYRRHLKTKISPIILDLASRLGIDPPDFQIRELGNRWGSCGKNGHLFFHWQLARLDLARIEFVCAHEMVHLLEPNHTPRFRKLLSQLTPHQLKWVKELSL